MLDILTLYSKPKPTPNMESKQEIKKENNKPAKKKKAKRILTDEEIKLATEKLTTGEMDLKEVAALLGVTQTLLKPLLKTLKNGKK
jgi:DNA-binding NtrC family response regulator